MREYNVSDLTRNQKKITERLEEVFVQYFIGSFEPNFCIFFAKLISDFTSNHNHFRRNHLNLNPNHRPSESEQKKRLDHQE